MKQYQQFRLLVLFLVCILALGNSFQASAQGVYTLQITLSVVQVSPGAKIEISGTHFEPDVLVTFVVVQGGRQTQLGTFHADDHGDFDTAVLLPYDLPFGEYEFRGINEKGEYAVAPLFIVPDPNEEQGGEQREEEDPLLAPMPTYAPGVSVTPMTKVGAEVPAAEQPSTPWMTVLVAASVLIILVFGLLLVQKVRAK